MNFGGEPTNSSPLPDPFSEFSLINSDRENQPAHRGYRLIQ